MSEQKEAFFSSVLNCARCEEDHERILFGYFRIPVVDSDGTIWDKYGTCPSSGDPILMMSKESDDKLSNQKV